MMQSQFRLAFVQHACTEDKTYNLKQSLAGIEEAAKLGADCVVLPELHASLYFCQTENMQHYDLAEPLDGPTAQALQNAAKTHGSVIVG